MNSEVSAYCCFCPEIHEDFLLGNKDLLEGQEKVNVQFVDISGFQVFDFFPANPKYKLSLIGLPAIAGTKIFSTYHGRLKSFTINTSESGLIMSCTEFTKIPTIELDELESIPTDKHISDRIIRMIKNRSSIRCKTALIVGGSGSGKTTLTKYLNKNVKNVKNLWLVKFLSDLERGSYGYINDVFALDEGIITIDDIDIIAPHDFAVSAIIERIRKASTKPVIFIATSRLAPYALPPQLASAFDNSLSFNALSYSERLHNCSLLQFTENQNEYIARETSGLSRGEFDSIIRTLYYSGNFSEESFGALLRSISTSERPMMLKVQKVEVCGYEDVLKEVRLILNISLRGTEEQNKMLQYSGILLHGPSGNGKTLIVRSMASEFEVPFFVVEFDKIFSRYLGDSERAIRDVFAAARFFAPSVVVIEDIDALGGKRSDESGVGGRVLSALLNELDGVSERARVVVVATTNKPELVDAALVRSGRFDRRIEVGDPSDSDRRSMFDLMRSRTPVAQSVTSEDLSAMAAGLSCAEVASFFRFAALRALREGKSEVALEDFEAGKERVAEKRGILARMRKQ